MRFLAVKNWRTFQHYSDRRPPWIKLYVSLLDDLEFFRLSDSEQIAIVKVWMLAARVGHPLPNDPRVIQNRAGVKPRTLQRLIDGGWIELVDEPDQQVEWASRHIPDEVRDEVWKRDGGKCRHCGGTDHVEIDHVIPISRGGTGDIENLQLLCRKCNRKKRQRTSVPDESLSSDGLASVQHPSSDGPASRADARSREGEGEGENRERTTPSPAAAHPDDWSRHFGGDSAFAAQAYRKLHRHPDAFDRALAKLAAPITGGGFGWDLVGRALVEMHSNGKEWHAGLCAGYCKRLKAGPAPKLNGNGRHAARRSRNLEVLAASVKEVGHG
jgi:hypothetical protein